MTTKTTKKAKASPKAALTTSDDGTVLLTFRQRESGIKPWRKRQIVCTSVEDATRAYQEARDLSGLGVSCFDEGLLSTGHRISYDGRVFRGRDLVLEADGSAPAPVEVIHPLGTLRAFEGATQVASEPVEAAAAPAPKKRSRDPEKVRAATARPQAAKEPKGSKPQVVHARTSLAGVSAAYVAHLVATKSAATASSYRGDLAFACRALGGDTLCSDLTARKVKAYFTSEAVTKGRDGKPKSPISIAKTRRVLRLALEWAAAQKLISALEIPEVAS